MEEQLQQVVRSVASLLSGLGCILCEPNTMRKLADQMDKQPGPLGTETAWHLKSCRSRVA